MTNLFDLNIEQVLEHWRIEHALREIIANAIDEQILTGTKDIAIYEDPQNCWHIRDYGRGLQYIHFTQNENDEKLQSPNIIGKFGVGLKDALAVFHRCGAVVKIYSKYAAVTLCIAKKMGFNVETLHAAFDEPKDPQISGTEFVISEISAEDMRKAKDMFLCFSNAQCLETTKYGDVYEVDRDNAHIYVNGVLVAKEDNFMFSYNITNLSAQMKKALNRERTNVGRTAYSDSVKKILTQCKSTTVLTNLVEDLNNMMMGTSRDESSWIDVSTYAAKMLNENKEEKVVFLTPYERDQLTNQQQEILEQSEKKIVFITETIREKLGTSVVTFANVMQAYNDSFEYKFVPLDKLTEEERSVFDRENELVANFLKRHGYKHNAPIYISETIRVDTFGESTAGVHENGKIIIKRKTLSDNTFISTLIHEFAHYQKNEEDNTRAFENTLTEMLGQALKEMEHANVHVGGLTRLALRHIISGLFARTIKYFKRHLNREHL
jgi:hypothetical protein